MTAKGKGNQREQSKNRYQRNKDFLKNYKKNLQCHDCGYCEFPEILCFHHNWGEKKFEINEFRVRSQDQILEEIKKCIVLCPNCHAVHHHKMRIRDYGD